MEPWVIIVLIAVGLFTLSLVILLAIAALGGAAYLFYFAIEQGFIGLAAYVAAWVFMFPVMLVISTGIGVFIIWDDWRTERQFRLLARRVREQREHRNSN